MQTYAMMCTCGHEMKVEADSREEAITKMKEGMTQAALDEHMQQFHRPDDAKPSLTEAHAQITQNLAEVVPVVQ